MRTGHKTTNLLVGGGRRRGRRREGATPAGQQQRRQVGSRRTPRVPICTPAAAAPRACADTPPMPCPAAADPRRPVLPRHSRVHHQPAGQLRAAVRRGEPAAGVGGARAPALAAGGGDQPLRRVLEVQHEVRGRGSSHLAGLWGVEPAAAWQLHPRCVGSGLGGARRNVLLGMCTQRRGARPQGNG